MDANDWASLGRACVEINAHLQRLNANGEKEMDSMYYKIVGADGYKPHPAHLENIASSLVDDAKIRCKDWKEIRIDANGKAWAYDVSPTKKEREWGFESKAFRLADLSTELEAGLNWQTFGIIRTEETKGGAENATKNAPSERTIADIVTIADNRLTTELITAIATLAPTAQAYLFAAIADGRIVV